MRYMMLIYTKEADPDCTSPEEAERIRQGHTQVITETRKRGMLVAVNPLARTSNATTVRIDNGKPLVTDGPFAETKEQLLGFYILDCPTLEEAITAAKLLWREKPHGTLEIRPVAVFHPADLTK